MAPASTTSTATLYIEQNISFGASLSPTRFIESGSIPSDLKQFVIVLPNDTHALECILRAQANRLAGVIMEPIDDNSGTGGSRSLVRIVVAQFSLDSVLIERAHALRLPH